MAAIPQDAVPVRTAAAALNVSCMTIYRAIRGALGPGLPTYTRAGRRHVSLNEAREYLGQHSAAPLRPAPSGETAPKEAAALVEELAARIPSEPEAVLRALATDVNLLNRLGPAVARVMVAAAEGHRRAQTAERKAADLLTPEQYVKDLRASVELLVQHFEATGAKTAARRSVELLRPHVAIQPGAECIITPLLERAAAEGLNASFDACEADLKTRCAKLRK